MAHLYLAIAILSEVIATNLLRATEGFTKPIPTIIVAVGYGTAFFLLSLVVKSIPVGIVYAIWSGAGIVLIALVSWLWFKQPLDPPALLGLLLIMAGVIVVNLFSKTVHIE